MGKKKDKKKKDKKKVASLPFEQMVEEREAKLEKKSKKKAKEAGLKRVCRNCWAYQHNPGFCGRTGPTLCIGLMNNYLSIGFGKDTASDLSWFQPAVGEDYVCKYWDLKE